MVLVVVTEIHSEWRRCLLNRTSVLDMKLGFASNGSRKFFAQAPATSMDESWPSFALILLALICSVGSGDHMNLLIFGVMNIHCGNLLFFKSESNMVKFLILANRSRSILTES